jgi:hypothetical protein
MSQVEEVRELNVWERFRESHHALARMIAAGMTTALITQRTGYSRRRITILLGDPSFNELIAVYSKRIEEKWDENVDAYLDLGMGNMIRAESQIAEHLDKSEDTGELLPVGVLDRISQGRADRFGYSKHTVLHHNHDFASALDRAIARSGKAPPQIEAQAEPAALNQPLLPPPPERVKAPPLPPARSFSAVLNPIKRRRVA